MKHEFGIPTVTEIMPVEIITKNEGVDTVTTALPENHYPAHEDVKKLAVDPNVVVLSGIRKSSIPVRYSAGPHAA
jgi:hypothetical protein